MARYRLLTPHFLEIGPNRVAQQLAAGTIIDSASLPVWWEPTPMMLPLDDEAEALHRAVVEKIRAANAHAPGAVPAVGPMHRMPGGDIHEAERRARAKQETVDDR